MGVKTQFLIWTTGLSGPSIRASVYRGGKTSSSKYEAKAKSAARAWDEAESSGGFPNARLLNLQLSCDANQVVLKCFEYFECFLSLFLKRPGYYLVNVLL